MPQRKEPRGSLAMAAGLWRLALTNKLLRLLDRRKATNGLALKTLVQQGNQWRQNVEVFVNDGWYVAKSWIICYDEGPGTRGTRWQVAARIRSGRVFGVNAWVRVMLCTSATYWLRKNKILFPFKFVKIRFEFIRTLFFYFCFFNYFFFYWPRMSFIRILLITL